MGLRKTAERGGTSGLGEELKGAPQPDAQRSISKVSGLGVTPGLRSGAPIQEADQRRRSRAAAAPMTRDPPLINAALTVSVFVIELPCVSELCTERYIWRHGGRLSRYLYTNKYEKEGIDHGDWTSA